MQFWRRHVWNWWSWLMAGQPGRSHCCSLESTGNSEGRIPSLRNLSFFLLRHSTLLKVIFSPQSLQIEMLGISKNTFIAICSLVLTAQPSTIASPSRHKINHRSGRVISEEYWKIQLKWFKTYGNLLAYI